MSELWGGRFTEPLDQTMRRFSTSLPVDRRFARYDLEGSRAHAQALFRAGILNEDERVALENALRLVLAEVEAGTFPPLGTEADAAEDVHSAVEARLVELVGDVGKKLHAGRSRNDQVVTDVLLWLRDGLAGVIDGVLSLQRALVDVAERHRDLVWYAYTHQQRAQPVLAAHHLLAHVEALGRDVERLGDAKRRADRSPLGAGACVGSTLPLDRPLVARELGFASVATNSLDAVSDRDWAIEAVSACALVMTHLSRIAAELVWWSSQEMSTARIGDAYCTGSSMMPQKRNPDVAELVRGKTARVMGALTSLHMLLHGLPLAYNRDLQEDKAPLLDAIDTTTDCTRLLAAAVASTTLYPPRAAGPELSSATDLAEELVRRGVPFRTAHERTGRLVLACEKSGRGLERATDQELQEAGLEGLDRALLTPMGSVRAKQTLGSTHPNEVAASLERWRQRLAAG
ncbi:MAG: argininosuccinate lyase [Myxococcota bacterium]